ncbi:MAG: HNH endonuclease [Ardenticatenia bacterium]|nr:HNH endonuclease [Ardenticatenia bacterium]
MSVSPFTWTLLEKAAYDNGFDLEGLRIEDWRTFSSSQTSLRVWLGGIDDTLFIVALSRWHVFEALDGLGSPWTKPLPPGAPAARSTGDLSALHRLLRRAFQLSRALPDEPLQVFLQKTATMPTTTEAERTVVQRVGQDLFRSRLIDYWEGRCAITGLAVVELLRASHIKPWADCATDAERLDVFNGLLLAPHLDAAFDLGFMTLNDEGHVMLAHSLGASARATLGFDGPLQAARLTGAHRMYLRWHRERVFRGS